jgi:hypothetical protein
VREERIRLPQLEKPSKRAKTIRVKMLTTLVKIYICASVNEKE